MAIWGMGVMIGPIMGPTLGGFLTDHYDWRWVFYINVPFGLLAAAGLLIFLPNTRESNFARFDWLGFAVLSTGIGALQLMLDLGQDQAVAITAVGATATRPAAAIPFRATFKKPLREMSSICHSSISVDICRTGRRLRWILRFQRQPRCLRH